MFKKVKKVLTAVLFCSVLLSGCGDSPPSETVTETTEQTTVTMPKYTEEELDQMAQNMPEIVFIQSFRMYDTNIYGYFITNTGEMKMFDFRQIAPDEYYEIPDVVERIDEAVCDKINILYEGVYYGDTIFDYQLKDVPKEEITECYKKLLLVDEKNIYAYDNNLDSIEYSMLYGIRLNSNNEVEVQILTGIDKIKCYDHDDMNARELINLMLNKYFPNSNDYK